MLQSCDHMVTNTEDWESGTWMRMDKQGCNLYRLYRGGDTRVGWVSHRKGEETGEECATLKYLQWQCHFSMEKDVDMIGFYGW